jgi:hypothetical protein
VTAQRHLSEATDAYGDYREPTYIGERNGLAEQTAQKRNQSMAMNVTVIYDVDTAADIKSYISTGNPAYRTPALKDDIIAADDDDLLRIGFTIDSPLTIVSVDKVDSDFFKRNLLTPGEPSGNQD